MVMMVVVPVLLIAATAAVAALVVMMALDIFLAAIVVPTAVALFLRGIAGPLVFTVAAATTAIAGGILPVPSVINTRLCFNIRCILDLLFVSAAAV